MIRVLFHMPPAPLDVFISHKLEDSYLAALVGRVVSDGGHRPYLDVLDPTTATLLSDPAGLAAHLEGQLRQTQAMLVVVGPQTQASWWVPYEIGFARCRGLPVAVIDSHRAGGLPEYCAPLVRQAVSPADVLRQSMYRGWLRTSAGRRGGVVPLPPSAEVDLSRLEREMAPVVDWLHQAGHEAAKAVGGRLAKAEAPTSADWDERLRQIQRRRAGSTGR